MFSEIVWDGVTRPQERHESEVAARSAMIDAAKAGEWARVLEAIQGRPEWANISRTGGKAWFAPLHHAAWGGAPVAVIERLVKLGSWRTLQNARGERPIDVAVRRGQTHVLKALEPVLVRWVPTGVLLKIQSHFHAVIRGRTELGPEPLGAGLRLPELEPLLEMERGPVWFAVPGMFGGFKYWLERDGIEAKLISESCCRVVEGSGERHEVTSEGARLTATGLD